MSKKIWTIEFIAGNPEIFSKVRSTEAMTRKKAMETWSRMNAQNPGWRMWLIRDGANTKIVDRSNAQIEWEGTHD